MNAPAPVLRFAPSPTGLLHLGHAYSAFFAYDLARREGGRFLLRIEDIDLGRCRPEFEEAIYEDLAWLGLNWEVPVRRQSDHMESYATAAKTLVQQGFAYPCFCTRRDITQAATASASAPHMVAGSTAASGQTPGQTPDGAPRYPGTCRHLSSAERADRMASGEAYALRLDTEAAARSLAVQGDGPLTFFDEGFAPEIQETLVDPGLFGDLIIARKDIPTSYHLSVCLDDALQGVSLVTRGKDLLPTTHVHRVLQALLNLPEPRYHHHPLIEDHAGQRLAKRDEARTLKNLRDAGETPETLRRMVGLLPQT